MDMNIWASLMATFGAVLVVACSWFNEEEHSLKLTCMALGLIIWAWICCGQAENAQAWKFSYERDIQHIEKRK